MRLWGVLGLMAGLMVGLSGCAQEEPKQGAGAAGSASEQEDANARPLRINLGVEPESLDPALMTAIPEGIVMNAVMEGLTRFDEKNQPVPAAAESWTASPDYRTFTFKLRPDGKWHNGDPVTASDFKYAIERVCTPSLAAQYASNVYSFIKGGSEYYAAKGLDGGKFLDTVTAVDPLTLQIELANPTPFFPSVVTFTAWLPVHRPTVEKHGSKWSIDAETYMGNGPFRMTELKSRDHITVEPAETYWDRASIKWKKINFLMIESEATDNNAFAAGDLDVTSRVAISELTNWRNKPEYHSVTNLATYYVIFNCQKPPFDDANVRKAFSIGADRTLITEKVTRRGETRSEGFVPRGIPGIAAKDFRDTSGDLVAELLKQDPKALLAASKYAGKLPPLEYSYNTADEHKLIAEQLQGMWKNTLGADVRLQNMEWGVFKGRLNSGDFQFARSSWFGDYVDPMTFLELFTSTNTQNRAYLRNPKYDALIEGARAEGDATKREKMLAEAERILVVEEAAVLPLYTYVSSVLRAADLEGVYLDTLGRLNFARGSRKVTK